MVAGEASAALDQVADIVEVIGQITVPGAKSPSELGWPCPCRRFIIFSPSRFSVTSWFILTSNQELSRAHLGAVDRIDPRSGSYSR